MSDVLEFCEEDFEKVEEGLEYIRDNLERMSFQELKLKICSILDDCYKVKVSEYTEEDFEELRDKIDELEEQIRKFSKECEKRGINYDEFYCACM